MNYNTIFAPAAAATRLYNQAQDWIASEAPVIEKKIHDYFWLGVAYAATVALWLIDQALIELDKIDEHEIRIRIYTTKAKRFIVCRAISLYSFVTYNGLDTKAKRFAALVLKVWGNRGAIARAAMDRVFCLG